MQHSKPKRDLASVVKERPFREFAQWWKMGDEFIQFMSIAIVSQWTKLGGTRVGMKRVQSNLDEYLSLVYGQTTRPDLLKNFIEKDFSSPFYSGEFDALSYAFYRSAFETIAKEHVENEAVIAEQRRELTKEVGKVFFSSVKQHFQLELPSELKTQTQFSDLQKNINLVGDFLIKQGYLREQCEFTFSVDVVHANQHIHQNSDGFLKNLDNNGFGYALYIMGYPAIFPSAVYLYQMFGEAQHHSSRTIEEIFERVGCIAHETHDFDPSNFPSDRVVELWSVRYIR